LYSNVACHNNHQLLRFTATLAADATLVIPLAVFFPT
jgi:hypothetical protein